MKRLCCRFQIPVPRVSGSCDYYIASPAPSSTCPSLPSSSLWALAHLSFGQEHRTPSSFSQAIPSSLPHTSRSERGERLRSRVRLHRINGTVPLLRVGVSYLPPDPDTRPAADIVQDFNGATIHLLEQDTSQAARRCESWSRIAQPSTRLSHRERQLSLMLLSLLLVQNMWTNSVSSHRFQIAIPPSLSPSTATAFNSDSL